jgi:HK97 family phage prohead protease
MPTPNTGESRNDFVSRCIPIVLDDGTAESQDQAVAICNQMWEDADKEQGKMDEHKMERKTFSGFVVKADEAQGIIEAVFAVFGNVDSGNDIMHPGSFTKTFAERGQQVRVLDNHRTDSIMRAIGKPLLLKEVRREELPPALLEKHPDATGGAFARVQMLMDTPEGKGAFVRLRDDAINEWSFGFDTLDTDFSTVVKDGKEINIRNLRTVKLYEISPVIFAMNEATMTVDAKSDLADTFVADVARAIAEGEDAAYMKDVSDATDLPLTPKEKAIAKVVENKAINLSQHVEDVVTTFYSKFPDIHNPNHGTRVIYWVKQVWDEFVIVEQEGTHGRRIWKVNYVVGEDREIAFSQQSDWIEVTMAFIPIEQSAPQPEVALEQQPKQAGPQDAPTSDDLLEELELLKLETETLEALL